MKIVFMGTPIFAEIVLEKLHQKYPVGLVVTQPDRKIGRKQIPKSPEAKRVAEKYKIEVFQPYNLREDYQKIIDFNPDVIVTAAYGQMLPTVLVEDYKCINVHGSLLPKHRGGAPIQRAIMEGDKKTGVTLMYMADKMDSGDIIDQAEIFIAEDDTTSILMEKLAYIGADLLLKHLKDIISDKAPRIKQNEDEVTFSFNLTADDELIDFNQTTQMVIRKLNGLLDEPGASFFINNKRIKVYKMKKSDIITSAKSGEVLNIKQSLTIKTKDGAVDILELQEQGKRKMFIKDYLNGQKTITKGDVANV